MKVLFIDSNHPYLHETLENHGYTCDLMYNTPLEEICRIIDQYHGIVIRSRFKLTKEILDLTRNLKFIARAGAGMENIDVEYAESKGIKCLHAPEGNKDAVGEHAIAMLLNLFNNINRADAEVRKGVWKREENRGIELMGKKVGIIGFGNMGTSFAKRLKGFDCEIFVYDKYKSNYGNTDWKECKLEELFEECDIISLHTPLTEETRFMINREFIQSFRKEIFIINTARGKCLKTSDLVEGLKSGKVKGACLDVLEYEAVSFEAMDSEKLPDDFKYLTQSDKVVLTPHIAGWSIESHRKIAETLVNKILAL